MDKQKIIMMLNSNQPKEVQELGIKYALQEEDKSFVLYYAEDFDYSDNCAKIFLSMSFDESKVYMDELFNWVEDSNTPGALAIIEYLINCPSNIIYPAFKKSLSASLKRKTKSLYNNLVFIFKNNTDLQNIIKDNDSSIYELLIKS